MKLLNATPYRTDPLLNITFIAHFRAECSMADDDQIVPEDITSFDKNNVLRLCPQTDGIGQEIGVKGDTVRRHHQQLKDALCGQMHFVLFSNKPNSTPYIFKQFLLALHFLFELSEARMNCLFVDLELFLDVHKKTQMPKVISNSLDVFPLIGVRLIKICGDQLVTADWVAKEAQTLGVCIARASDDPKRIPSPVDQLLWPCHLPCPRAKKFGGKCRDDDNFWGCEQCGQTFKFAKQNEGKEPKAPITHLFCGCGGTRVDHLTFRCAFFADHGVHFHAFTSLDLLNRELERQSKMDTVNLLLEGKTGNGKSTLINAMHFCAKFMTFEEALQLATLADFNSDSLAPATYSKSMLQNGKHLKIEAKLGGDTSRKIGQSQTQISAAYIIQSVEDGQTCCVIDTRGIDMDNQNMANTFVFLCEFDVLHGVGIMLEDHDRADESFKYCINDGILSNVHKNGTPNIVFLITHSSGSGKAIDVVSELLEQIEEENGVKIPLDDNVFSFDNAPFEALCLIKMKGVEYGEDEMEEFSEQWADSVQEFKRLKEHLATLKPHLTRETLSVYAARCAIADIIPIIASNVEQIQKKIAKLEIEELNKTIAEDEKKAEIKFDRVETKELDEPRMACNSEKCMEIVKTLEGDVKVYRRKDCAFDCSPFECVGDIGSIMGGMTVGTLVGGVLGVPVGSNIAVEWPFQKCKARKEPQILQKKDKKQIGSSSKSMFRWLFKKPKKDDANATDVRTLSKTDCAFVHFGTALLHRIEYRYRLIGPISAALSDFKNLISEREKECGTKAHREFDTRSLFYRDKITRDNTPSQRCVRLEMDLFREPLWNYARMVGIDSNKCLVGEGIAALKELLAILDQIIGHYANGTEKSCQLGKRRSIFLENFSNEKIKFSKILFETLSKYSQNVNYDEKRQLLTFPLSTGEHIITRLSELIRQQRHTIQNNKLDGLCRQIDVKKTIQNIASMEPIHFYKRKWTLSWGEWINFDLFLSMAIRLSAQIERNNLLNALLFGSPSYHSDYFFFDYKIQITNGNLVEMNTPTWHVPYFGYWGNNKDWMVRLFDHKRSKKAVEEALVQREARENFDLLRTLSEYSPTVYEVIKMAKILGNIENDGQILVLRSDPQIFHFILKYLANPTAEEESANQTKFVIKYSFCFLAQFVEELLKKAMKVNELEELLDTEFLGETIQRFAKKKEEQKCANKNTQNGINKYLKENSVDFSHLAHAIKIDFTHNDFYQKEMLEWKLIEIELINEEKIKKWEAIESARNEWREIFDRNVFEENERENGKLEEKMEQLMEELKHLQIEKEIGQNKNKEEKEKEEEKEEKKEKEGKKEKGKGKVEN
ncbi:hypothetical protein niasHT_035508 [Heterodera trifolii]|uniref:Uncharacterized protein n=1 Tax=Heterodera trifolii TaxID=157864 RepID=A0ABD2IXV5_9BILA